MSSKSSEQLEEIIFDFNLDEKVLKLMSHLIVSCLICFFSLIWMGILTGMLLSKVNELSAKEEGITIWS